MATGKKVNSSLDNPTNFFAAAAHRQRESDLSDLKDGIQEAIQVIRSADTGMVAMANIFKQASAIAENAALSVNVEDLSQYVDQFNEMRRQVDLLSADSAYRGINILHREDLTINLGNNTLTVDGADITSSGFDNMTNGLNVEAASMNPLNIVDPNYVLTAYGQIKEDGELTVINNDIPGIDLWLGDIGIKNQIITSQDVTLTTNTSFSDGRTIQSQMLDNVGVAEYGTESFEIYRDTSVSASITQGSGSVNAAIILDTPDVSTFLGPQLSSGSNPFTLQRDLSSSTEIVSGTANINLTTINNISDLSAYLGQHAGSASDSFELYREISASAAVVGDPSTEISTIIINQTGVSDFLGNLSGSGTSSFSLSRDVSLLPPVVNSSTGGVESLNTMNASDVAKFLGPIASGDSKEFTLYYNSSPPSWFSSDVDVTNLGGPPPTSIAIDLLRSGNISITADLTGTWSDGDSISVAVMSGPWKSNNQAVDVAVSGTDLDLDLNSDGTSDMLISTMSLLEADAVVDVDTAASSWKSTNSSVIVSSSACDLNLDMNGNGTTDITIQLASLSNADVRLKSSSYLSEWYADGHTEIEVNSSSNSLSLNLGQDATDDIKIFLSTMLYGDAKITVTPWCSEWKTTDSSISLNQPTSTGLMTADLNGDGNNDIQIVLPADGVNGATWYSTEKIQADTTGPFRTTDSSVDLKYDHDLKTVDLILANSNGADITINLAGSWAVNNLPTSPLGNGDSINLTVDGRHRWVKSDGVTPNASGMKLSVTEVEDAIKSLRQYSSHNSSNMSILTVRDSFIKNLSNILEEGADILTLADMNEEGANMLMLQTQQNLSVTSLSLASQSAQSVLKLFP